MSSLTQSSLNDILSNYKEAFVSYEDCNVNYLISDYSYEKGNDVIEYAKYFVVDARPCENHFCSKCYLNSKKRFDALVESICSYDFWTYTATDDMRKYNLYFILIVDNLNSVPFSRDVHSDFNFARKFILDLETAAAFLANSKLITRSDNIQYLDALHAIYELYEKNSMNYDSDLSREILLRLSYYYRQKNNEAKTNFLEKFKGLLKRNSNDQLLYHHKLANLIFYSDLANRRFSNNPLHTSDRRTSNKSKIDEDSVSIKQINKIIFNSYKNFANESYIDFALVNLLHGENGSGKTATLEAIEHQLTGSIYDLFSNSKWEKGYSVDLFYSTAVNSQIKLTVSEQSYEIFSKCWYRTTHNSLNAMFRKHNYFDSNGAVRFATELRSDSQSIDAFGTLVLDDVREEFRRQVRDILIQLQVEIEGHTKTQQIFMNYKRYPIEGDKRAVIKEIQQLQELDKEIIYSLALAAIKVLMFSNHVESELETQLDKLAKSSLDKQGKRMLRTAWMNIFRITLAEELERIMEKESKLKSESEYIQNNLESVSETLGKKIGRMFNLLTMDRDYEELSIFTKPAIAKKINSNNEIPLVNLSTGQKVCLSIATMLAFFTSNKKAPKLLIFDEPVAYLDPLHLLNLVDILRDFALSGVQVFFTASQPHVINLFKRKFSFLGNDLKIIKFKDIGSETIIEYESPYESKSTKTTKADLVHA